ncbi:hypothetical protein [Candidatus Paracaedibacter symbiosus]|uniref:hypothetical protein n=1 Tax=Candidatus Paracaedibacter symbiosus TaxID=244582 RepID=UPI000509D125|nr:hypothetical protein [Candidatus Paracaedibacter symbiosus]
MIVDKQLTLGRCENIISLDKTYIQLIASFWAEVTQKGVTILDEFIFVPQELLLSCYFLEKQLISSMVKHTRFGYYVEYY